MRDIAGVCLLPPRIQQTAVTRQRTSKKERRNHISKAKCGLFLQMFAEWVVVCSTYRRGRDSSVDIANRYGLGGLGVESRFSASVQTVPGAHPAYCGICTGAFPWIKWPRRGVNRRSSSSAEVKERAELSTSPLCLHSTLQSEMYLSLRI